ncbi:MAG TPA: hypothetical protein DEE98_01745 [Elusimicrobia bacterium]|nr:MAG: hypothetical protein A2278_01480 [Elusimicrobia bacterium RIFOXYA12_FULL_49_49]OGS10757.1 MAG: hypothetical protein A2386_04285 [Elusimicrobia bacterium RIFOXYB1_FULL_48_9]OGS15506.1 MAG: hypothetical protein A2251_03215 [Elusimicrobia bacterium RIFOXYA2_FULL_47_53]OGS27001.1 MAG: hypothetical protein A2339_04730 [Elusimicrobia bacterium RIFOXYB12_FULL_50_12]OGS30946.1 MAG: hypothetical protein A2323_00250 [Elusimicrobia bacterium RIFOXYB2_FULL_46_23]HBU69085.1 hypothetical protein [El
MEPIPEQLNGYKNLRPIGFWGECEEYRAEREAGGAVLLRAYNLNELSSSDISRIKSACTLLSAPDLKGLIRVESVYESGGRLFIVEDLGQMRQLSEIVNGPQDLGLFFDAGSQVCLGLEFLHSKGIVHGGVSSHNIYAGPHGDVRLGGIGMLEISQWRLSDGSPNPRLLSVSPEQTGRLNRQIDCRSDLYSLGIVLFHTASGKYPFESSDATELVYKHIATEAEELYKAVPGFHTCLSKIVSKLLIKDPDTRYYSASGVREDLRECRAFGSDRADFSAGQRDAGSVLRMPLRLFGRKEEIKQLRELLNKTIEEGAVCVAAVSGPAGIGKSALVGELQTAVAQTRGYFIKGKYDQYRRFVPYAGILEAFRELIRQLLMDSDQEVGEWKRRITDELGKNAVVVSDMISELSHIVGHIEPAEEFGPTETQNRFMMVFKDFIRVFCRKEKPLVLFLDDMQWADLASINLMEAVLSDDRFSNLMIIFSYRDNETGKLHPFTKMMEHVRESGVRIENITLAMLTERNVSELIADTPGFDWLKAEGLARIVYQRAGGNPFFVKNLMLKMHSEGKLRSINGYWKWDENDIKDMDATEDVVRLMIGRIHTLKTETQGILRFASTIGGRFGIGILAALSGKSPEAVFLELNEAISEGMIYSRRDEYIFAHDRIREAAYSLVDERERPQLHYNIGRLMLEKITDPDNEERIFEVCDHINFGKSIEGNAATRLKFARLNFSAGKRARRGASYELAARYLESAREYTGGQAGWRADYELAYNVNLALYESLFLSGSEKEAELIFWELMKNVRTAAEKAKAHWSAMVINTHLSRFWEAVLAGIDGLRSLGVFIPQKANKLLVLMEFLRVRFIIGRRTPEDLFLQPELTDPEKKLAATLCYDMGGPTYFISQDLFSVSMLKGAGISVKYGNDDRSSNGYMLYAAVLCGAFGMYKTGYEYGVMALRLGEKYKNQYNIAYDNFIFGMFVIHWKQPLKDAIDCHIRGHEFALRQGNFVLSSWCLAAQVGLKYFSGENLEQLLSRCGSAMEEFTRQKRPDMVLSITSSLYSALCLAGRTASPISFDDGTFSESKHVSMIEEEKAGLMRGLHYILKLSVLFAYGEYEAAGRICDLLSGKLVVLAGMYYAAVFEFYKGVVSARLLSDKRLGAMERVRHLGRLLQSLNKYRKWSKTSPENYSNKYYLLRAELAGISGNGLKALRYYSKSVEESRKYGFIQEEGAGNELAALYCISQGMEYMAGVYLRQARGCFQQWGAAGKVKSFNEKYAEILIKTIPAAEASGKEPVLSGDLDSIAVLRSSQAISEEISFDKLLKRLVEILIKNAGAQKGFLIAERDGRLFVEAGSGEDVSGTVVPGPLSESSGISISIVNYVWRTHESVNLKDASIDDKYLNDDYIARNRPKSLLCMPIRQQNKLSGILYCENNIVAGAFTDEHLEVLQMLSAQAAISIENAKLYSEMESRVKARTAELVAANDRLQKEIEQRQSVEQQLLQSQKMEAIGKLAGGIAHDFNNLMTAVLGNCAVLLAEMDNGDPKRQEIEEIKMAGERAAALTSQLLAFGRKQMLRRENVDLNSVIRDTTQMLRRTIGENVSVELQLGGEIDHVFADRVQLEHIIINLVLNGRDAIADSGKITLGTAVVDIDGGYCEKHPDAREGRFVRFSVEDNGSGMTSDVLQKLFEPFFTTKGLGKGTGLGLSTSYGIIKQHEGWITVESTPGKGTGFFIYLPVSAGAGLPPREATGGSKISAGSNIKEPNNRKVLVIEDEDGVRRFAVRVLSMAGFAVYSAENAKKAMDLYNQENGKFDLIFSDVILPDKNGFQVVTELRSMNPALPVILCSGYTDEKVSEKNIRDGGFDFLQKPYSMEQLISAVGKIFN